MPDTINVIDMCYKEEPKPTLELVVINDDNNTEHPEVPEKE